jgi:hypothetical protein
MEPARLTKRRAGPCGALLATLLVLTAPVACTVEYAPPSQRQLRVTPDADTSLVLAELYDYYRDFSARDWPRFAGHFWPGATIAVVWQPPAESGPRVTVTSVPDFVAAAPEGPGSREIFEERMVDARIRLTGGLAQAWVRYHARFGSSGDMQEWEGVDAFTLLRHDGQWRIVSLAFQSGDPES